jgi:FkbM family methyltransferase
MRTRGCARPGRVEPLGQGGLPEFAALKARELYWTITRALGLGHLHDGSPRTGGASDLVLLRMRELNWTIRRALGIPLHRQAGVANPVEPLAAALFDKMTDFQIRLDLLCVQAELAQAERAEIFDLLKRNAATFDLFAGQIESARPERAESFDLLKQHAARLDLLGGRVELALTELAVMPVPAPIGGDLMFRTPFGIVFAPADDVRLVAALWHMHGQLEPGTVSVMRTLLEAGDRAIDVGAHIGLTLLPMAQAVGPAGRVVAIEPGSRASGALRKAVVANGLEDRVELQFCAAGADEGAGSLQIGEVLGHSSLLDLPEAGSAEAVTVRPLDALVPSGQSVRLVKIDAEGYELQVWRGMRRILRDSPGLVAIVEFGPSHLRRAGVSTADWTGAFEAEGFTPYEIDESRAIVRRLRPLRDLDSVESVNLLMLRRPISEFPQLPFE